MAEQHFLVLDDAIASSIASALNKTFSTYDMQVCPEQWSVGRDIPLVFDQLHVAQIYLMQGSLICGSFIAAFNPLILMKLIDISSYDCDAIDDAAGEITNMMFGLFKTEINGRGYRFKMGLPIVSHDAKSSEWNFDHWDKLHLPFCIDGEPCWIAVAQKH